MSVTPLTSKSNELAAPPSSRGGQRINALPYLLLFPSILMILLIQLYPFLTALFYSFQNGSLLAPGSFVGLENYVATFSDPEFLYALAFSAIFAIFSVVGSYLLGLGLAFCLCRTSLCVAFFGSC